MTIRQVSALTGLSVRALHHYDQIGLLHPAQVTAAGYRLYDEASLARLQSILLFRELEFPLREIAAMLDCPTFDEKEALRQQIALLTMKKERMERLIALATSTLEGGTIMDFSAFDTAKEEEYARQAKASWGETAAWKEYEQKAANRTGAEERQLGPQLMSLFTALGTLRGLPPEDARVQARIDDIRTFITEHFYTCTLPILKGLGQMYLSGDMRDNIDRAGGEGTALLASQAIDIYCDARK